MVANRAFLTNREGAKYAKEEGIRTLPPPPKGGGKREEVSGYWQQITNNQ